MKADNQFFNVSLKLFLKNDRGEVLILKMQPDSVLAGYYDFPGGRISEQEVGIPFAKIAQREITEELGVGCNWEFVSHRPVAAAQHYYDSKKYGREIHVLWLFFEARYLGGEIKLSAEHADLTWVNLSKIELEKYFVRGALRAVKNYLQN